MEKKELIVKTKYEELYKTEDGYWIEHIEYEDEAETVRFEGGGCSISNEVVDKLLDKAREEVEKKFMEKYKKREQEMNVPYSEEDGKEFWQGYQEGYNQGLHDMIIDTYYLDKEFQSKLTTK